MSLLIYLSTKRMLGLLLWVFLQPLDHDFNYDPVVVESTETFEQPLYEWRASWYDYKLWGKWWSKSHSTCALRIHERYKTYRVCVDENCITCYHNDYWPQRENRVIDLSSYAFKQLAPLSKWLVYVKVYLEN